MRTWHYEAIFIGLILSSVTYFAANNLINWVSTVAIFMTFMHAQIGDRLQERQGNMEVKTVACYWKMSWYFGIKEILWIFAFILMENYAAIVGSFLFFLYPFWRKFYRKHIKSMEIQ